jgi:thymidylate synthase
MNIWHPEFLGIYPPCIYSYQIRIIEQKINLIVIQRSCDIINVLPINLIMSGYILSYFANKTNYNMDKIIFQIGDAHIYNKDI